MYKCEEIKEIIIATTTEAVDDKIEQFCIKNKINYFRGSENDVLDRLAKTIEKYKIGIHVECFGDSPLPDPQVIDEMVEIFRNNTEYDYVSNSIKPTFPSGLEVNIYKGETLLEINKLLARNDPLREHGGYNISRFPDKYSIYSHLAQNNMNFPQLSLEVDEERDLNFLKKIITYFSSQKIHNFSTEDIIRYVQDNPSLLKINRDVHRRWKELKGQKN